MPKGFFTQGAAILLSRAVTFDELEPLLRSFRIVKRNDEGAHPDLSGPSLIVAFRPELNGYVSVDVQSRRWPDHMGDPRQETDLFGAWSMGHFGPFAFPGGLQRAAEHSWSWEAGRSMPDAHRAFVRIRHSYVFGADDAAILFPADCDPVAELQFATTIARALLEHPAALAYFNPNGEALCNRERIDFTLEGCARLGVAPINIWSNIRMFKVTDEWLMMDSVGMLQLDRPDSEACFLRHDYDPSDVDHFLRNVGLYLMDKGEVIKDGDTMDGPGNVRWCATHVQRAVMSPPRRVLRWSPLDGSTLPAVLRAAVGNAQ